MIVSAVPPEQVFLIWDKVNDHLVKAVNTTPGKATIGDVFDKCSTGEMVLWVILDGKEIIAAATTTVVTYPRKKALGIVYVGGTRILEWRDIFLEKMESFARTCGLQAMEGYGREAWERMLRGQGWFKAYTVFEKDLTGG